MQLTCSARGRGHKKTFQCLRSHVYGIGPRVFVPCFDDLLDSFGE